MVIKANKKKKKKKIESPMSENFMDQENRRNSSHQKKGKVDSPHSLFETFVIAWILDQALLSFVGGTNWECMMLTSNSIVQLGFWIIIICWRNQLTGFWIANQSNRLARMRRPQITERKREGGMQRWASSVEVTIVVEWEVGDDDGNFVGVSIRVSVSDSCRVEIGVFD